MKNLALVSLLVVLTAVDHGVAQDSSNKSAPSAPAVAAASGPATLVLEVTAIRFKPNTKEQVLEEFPFSGSTSNIIETLSARGRSVDVVYRGVRELIPDEKTKAVFDATETRPVMIVGRSASEAPPATAFGLKLEVTAKGAPEGRFAVFWEGNIVWSPELMDRRVGMQNTLVFVSKAATAAQKVTHQVSSDASVQQAADLGLALAQLFGPSDKSATGSIYELPVVKTLGLTGSCYCRSGDLVVLSTSAEAGTKEPQTLFLLVRATAKE